MGRPRGPVSEEGLAGILVTLVILGLLAAVVVVAVQRSGGTGATPVALPGGLVTDAGPGAGTAAPSAGGVQGTVGAARVDECLVNAQTLATAAQTYQATRGSWPAGVDALVAAGMLASAPSVPGYAYTVDQAGGRVLVNGAAPDAGCRASSAR